MKSFVKTLALVAVMGLPLPAMAQNYQPFPVVAAPPVNLSTCPQASSMNQMHNNMTTMTQDIDAMIRDSGDRATRDRLEFMRDQMNSIASDMVRETPAVCGVTAAPAPAPRRQGFSFVAPPAGEQPEE